MYPVQNLDRIHQLLLTQLSLIYSTGGSSLTLIFILVQFSCFDLI